MSLKSYHSCAIQLKLTKFSIKDFIKIHISQNLFQRKHHQTSSIRVKGKLVAKNDENTGILSEWKRKNTELC